MSLTRFAMMTTDSQCKDSADLCAAILAEKRAAATATCAAAWRNGHEHAAVNNSGTDRYERTMDQPTNRPEPTASFLPATAGPGTVIGR